MTFLELNIKLNVIKLQFINNKTFIFKKKKILIFFRNYINLIGIHN
jgi:hypothetical protein